MNKTMKLSKMTMPVILTLVFGLGLVSCTGETTKKDKHTGVEYYRNLQFSETPFDIENGTYPLTAEEAKSVNSYKFTYDDNGRLLSVEFVRGDVLLGYSSMGGSAKIVYNYIGNKQIKHFFNKDNEPIESGGAFTAEYSLDENGIRNGLMFKDKEGAMIENRNNIHNYTWIILDDGMVQEKRYNMTGEEVVMNPFCPFYELRFSYNDMGYVTRMANYMGDTLYNCTAENCGDIGVSYFLFEASEKGDLESFSVFNVYGQMANLFGGWSKRMNKFDENGNVVETAVFDQDDEYVAGNSIPVFQRVYDSHGSVTEVRNMDKDRNIINHPESGVAITEYKYDEIGNRTETIKYDKDRVEVKM
jgi:YD repeat-containing protein